MDTIEGSRYFVRSFFGALHALLYRCLPPCQTLPYYLKIFFLFSEALAGVLRPILFEPQNSAHSKRPKMALLVCLLYDSVSSFSRVIIGFSVFGDPQRRDLIEDRTSMLKSLSSVQPNGLRWQPGNCAEVETFCHLNLLQKKFPDVGGSLPRCIPVILTIDLFEQNMHGPCKQCSQLMHEFKSRAIKVYSLAPIKGASGVG
jgi:hypothetical protein